MGTYPGKRGRKSVLRPFFTFFIHTRNDNLDMVRYRGYLHFNSRIANKTTVFLKDLQR